jgi:lysophospholipase L1-like esterase
MNSLKLNTGDKIIFIGDSITDCGRRKEFAPLGNGYVSIVANLVTAKYPERTIEWVNKGVGSETVQMLAERWTTDVIQEAPTWVSIAIGINNVGGYNVPPGLSENEALVDFEKSYRQILNSTRNETRAQFILSEVFYILEEDEARRRYDVNPYNKIIYKVANEFGVMLLIPLNSVFQQARSKGTNHSWTTGDGVHPNAVGHTLIALEILKVLDW